jgi:glutamine amidotransferase
MIISETRYGKSFCSSFNYKNIFGVQFHPEKSQNIGKKIIKNFSNL